MARRRNRTNVDWETPESFGWDHVLIEVLMDVREELRKLNAVLACPNFLEIPQTLRTIRKHTGRLPSIRRARARVRA